MKLRILNMKLNQEEDTLVIMIGTRFVKNNASKIKTIKVFKLKSGE